MLERGRLRVGARVVLHAVEDEAGPGELGLEVGDVVGEVVALGAELVVLGAEGLGLVAVGLWEEGALGRGGEGGAVLAVAFRAGYDELSRVCKSHERPAVFSPAAAISGPVVDMLAPTEMMCPILVAGTPS